MKKRILILLVCLLTGGIWGAENLQVIARGMGKDAASATKDALVQAVQQAVGAMVDSETLMKNDAVLKEQVLTFSDGFVSKYEVLKAPAPNKYGLYETTIKAQVEQKKLRGRLAETRILKIEVKNAQNIWAKLETEQLRKENAETMLLKIFSLLNPKDFLNPTLVDPQKRMGKDAKLNVFRKDGKTYISMGILIAFDHKKYVREVQPYLLDAMNKLCLDKSGPWMDSAEDRNDITITFETDEGRKQEKFGSTFHHKTNIGNKDISPRFSYVFVNSGKRPSRRFQQFIAYRFPRWDDKIRKKIENIIGRNLVINVFLKDASGEIISAKEIKINSYVGESVLCHYKALRGSYYFSDPLRCVTVSPEMTDATSTSSHIRAYDFTCEISPDELKDIKSIELTIKEKEKK